MFAIILSFIQSHIKVVAIGGVVTAILAIISLQHIEIKNLQEKLQQAKLENTTLEVSNKKLIAALKNQNYAVSLLQQETEKKKALAKKSLAKAKTLSAKYSKNADNIRNQKSSGDECNDIINLLNNL